MHKRPVDRRPSACRIVNVRQIPQNRGSLLVRETRQVVGVVIAVPQTVAVEIGPTRAVAGRVIPDRDLATPLCDREQAIRIIKPIDNMWLPRHRHCRPAEGIIMRIDHAALERGLTEQEVQPVIIPGGHAGDRIHHPGQTVAVVEGMRRGRRPAFMGRDAGTIHDIVLGSRDPSIIGIRPHISHGSQLS